MSNLAVGAMRADRGLSISVKEPAQGGHAFRALRRGGIGYPPRHPVTVRYFVATISLHCMGPSCTGC